jgi:hypothetical protein
MRQSKEPLHWKRLVTDSAELATETPFEVTETWTILDKEMPSQLPHNPRVPSLLNKDLSKSEGDLQASLPITPSVCNAEENQSVCFADHISASEGDNTLPP